MTLNKSFTLLLLAFSLGISSCSGVKAPCTKNCNNGGSARVLVTLTAAPTSPITSTNLLSFSATIAGVSLTPSTGGNPVNVPLNNATFTVDLTHLQSDSALLAASASIPTATYSSMTISFAAPVVTYCTQTIGAAGCTAGSVATVTGAAAAPQLTTSPFPITLTANQTQGLAVNINLQNALTVNTAQVVTAVNLGASNVVTAGTLPPALSSLSNTNELSFIDDVTGVVTAVSGSTVTVKTATQGSFTATANSSTVFSPNCTSFKLGLTFAACVINGQVASLDMVLNKDGTFTLLEYDPLATTSSDWVEGMVTAQPASTSQFLIVANNEVVSPSNTILGSNLSLASPVTVTLVNPQPFQVDGKGYIPANTASTFSNTGATILQPGETVAVRVTGFTAGSGSTPAGVNADFLYLRFTRVTGTIASVAPPNTFNIQTLPPFFGITTPQIVQLSSGVTGSPNTNFDGTTSASGSNFTVGSTVSISAIYFGPPNGPTPMPSPFYAAKVRVP